ncbi:MAG: UDP-N-acetylmuramoyl-L-alanine--D-glutamate ligase, partial [Verrucomicrobiota bacterium]|nr:UDP-N-acetylmuramoyl-L-alanine--D-glutamate ligase [Verrucomicrobiota bacterium]
GARALLGAPARQPRRSIPQDRGVRPLLGAPTAAAGASAGAERQDVAVVSPGAPADSAVVRELEALGIPVISELELGASRCACPLLAVTGTNGKSTMAKLCAESLIAAGRRVALAGNYGRALCRAAPEESRHLDWLVVEVSSFQLEKAATFRPRVGVALNVQPNHLDRHGTLEAYGALKMRMFARMEKGDVAVLHDEAAGRFGAPVPNGGPIVTTFGISNEADYRFGGNRVWMRTGRRLEPAGGSVGFEKTIFGNEILGLTAAAAVAAVEACGEDPVAVAKAARTFEPLPHRMQTVAEIRGVAFVDDSKATNLSALCAALRISSDRVALIAGGMLKETDLRLPAPWLDRKVRQACLIGRDGPKLKEAWDSLAPCRLCVSLEEAVRAAWAERARVDTILLSPGGASFDQFDDFEDRGRKFADIAVQIQREETQQ